MGVEDRSVGVCRDTHIRAFHCLVDVYAHTRIISIPKATHRFPCVLAGRGGRTVVSLLVYATGSGSGLRCMWVVGGVSK